ncbi:MAG: hypothetical protein HOM71_07960, partial [Deltaproteobacteria bacterium]|nr:hypothetical protein [Deltaproteobacteria bacterium]
MAKSEFKKLEKQVAGQQSSGPSFILFVVALLVALLTYWSTIAELDIVTRGEGKLIAAADNQVVQASEGGVIINRFIEENESVFEKQILFEIDPVDVSAEYEKTKQRLRTLKIKKNRLDFEVSGGEFEGQTDLKGGDASVITAEKNLFLSRRQELANKISIHENKILQVEKQLLSIDSSLKMEIDLQEFIDREVDLLRPLVK